MRHGSRILVGLVGIVVGLAFTTAAWACPDGAYVIDGGPLLPGIPERPPDAVVIVDGLIAIGSPLLHPDAPEGSKVCGFKRVKVRKTPKGFRIRAYWPACEGFTRVRLRAHIDPSCREMSGVITAPKFSRRFAAHPCSDASMCVVSCIDDADCAGRWCAKPKGDCAGSGICLNVDDDVLCPELVEPVCGCDGHTYGNECKATSAGVNVRHDGACDSEPTPKPTPTRGDLDGTYDVALTTGSSGHTHDALGIVETKENGLRLRIEVSSFDSIDLNATARPDGSFALSGHRILGADMYVSTTGTATAVVNDHERRIRGTITDFFATVGFEMVRPANGTPTTWSGSYVLTFDPSPSGCACSSTATLALTVAPDGTASLGDGSDDASGNVVGAFSNGRCIVSPVGRIDCTAGYQPAEPDAEVFPFIVLHGALARDGGGSGQFLRGLPPSPFILGAFTIVRDASARGE